MSKNQYFLLWDVGETVAALLLAAAAYVGLFFSYSSTSSCVIALITDFIAALILLETGLRSVRPKRTLVELPHRIAGLFILPLLLVTLVCSFGNMYLHSGEVRDQHGCLETPLDAAYFSPVTLSTVGYGDYSPTGPKARKLVLWQLASGVLLLLVALPILVSRLAIFAAESQITLMSTQQGAKLTVNGSSVSLPYVLSPRSTEEIIIAKEGFISWSCRLQVIEGKGVVEPLLQPELNKA